MGLAGCRNSYPPPAAPRGAGPGGPAFTFAPPSPHPLPQDPRSWRGPRWAEDQARDLSRPPGSQVGMGNLAMPLLILCPPNGPPVSPFGCGIPSPPPAVPQGCQSHPASTSPLPSLPPHPRPTRSLGVPPVPLGVRGPPPVPGRCPSCAETRIPCPPSPPS